MTALLLALALLAPAPPAWSVVVLVPDGTTPETERAQTAVAAALAWWQTQGVPVPPVTPGVTVDTLPDTALAYPPLIGRRTIVILQTDDLILGRDWGLATPDHIWAVSGGMLPATLAHEMGHAFYGLPDTRDCLELDIMCQVTFEAAYRSSIVGRTTRAALGLPCWTLALPEVVR